MIVDYNKPITRIDIDLNTYKTKFEYVDTYETSNTSDLQTHSKILLDPTMFAYSHLSDGNNSPLQLYSYQDMIINDTHRFIYFRAANQIGKSFLFNVKCVFNLLHDHGHAHNEAIVSKSLPQSIHQMRRIKGMLNSMRNINWQMSKGGSDSMSVVTVDFKDDNGVVKYSNLLICAPCTEGLLGYDLHDLNLDEFEFWEVDLKYFFNQIAQPRTYKTKGNVMIMSNPNGMDNFGSVLEKQFTPSGDKKWHLYVFNYLDCPGNTQAEYDQLKLELSRQEFESTVDAKRSISDRNYFTPDEIDRSYDPKLRDINMINKQPFFFLDVGAKHDRSVLIGGYVDLDEENQEFAHIHIPIIHVYPEGYPLTRVAGVDNVSDADGWHHEKSVKEHLTEWTIGGTYPVFGYDVTGNAGMLALFESISVVGEDVIFSGPNKSGMYQRFKYFMEKGLLHRIKHDKWEKEAGTLVVTKGVRGYLLINAASAVSIAGKSEDAKLKRIPDDCMDATAGFIQLCDPKDIVKPSLKLF